MENLNIKQLQLAIYLRLNQLKREQLATITYQNIIDTLFDSVWKDQYPQSLNHAINDIMSINAERIVAYLSKKAIIESKDHSLEDFDDLIKE